MSKQPRTGSRVSDNPYTPAAGTNGRSAFYGMRVSIHSGPRAGKFGTVLRARSSRQFDVLLDGEGQITVLRSAVLQVGGPIVRGPRGEHRGRYGSVSERVLRLFTLNPSLERVVVYRTDAGRTFVVPWREQEVGPGLVGVYARDVDPARVEEDALS